MYKNDLKFPVLDKEICYFKNIKLMTMLLPPKTVFFLTTY